jgi:hypothetical protein
LNNTHAARFNNANYSPSYNTHAHAAQFNNAYEQPSNATQNNTTSHKQPSNNTHMPDDDLQAERWDSTVGRFFC